MYILIILCALVLSSFADLIEDKMAAVVENEDKESDVPPVLEAEVEAVPPVLEPELSVQITKQESVESQEEEKDQSPSESEVITVEAEITALSTVGGEVEEEEEISIPPVLNSMEEMPVLESITVEGQDTAEPEVEEEQFTFEATVQNIQHENLESEIVQSSSIQQGNVESGAIQHENVDSGTIQHENIQMDSIQLENVQRGSIQHGVVEQNICPEPVETAEVGTLIDGNMSQNAITARMAELDASIQNTLSADVSPPKKKLVSLQYNYSDSDDEETREERKARIVSHMIRIACVVASNSRAVINHYI